MPRDTQGSGVSASVRSARGDEWTSGRAARTGPGRSASGLRWGLAMCQLVAGDVAAVVAAVGFAWLVGWLPLETFGTALIGLPLLVGLVFWQAGLYRRARLLEQDVPVVAILGAWGAAVATFAVLTIVQAAMAGSRSAPWPGMAPLALAIGLGAALLLGRRLVWRLAGPPIARPVLRRIAVIGDERAAAGLKARLEGEPGLACVGVVHEAGDATHWKLQDLADLVREDQIDTALVAASAADPATLHAVMDQARMSTLDVHVVPDSRTATSVGRCSLVGRLGGIAIIELHRRPLDVRAMALKRAEDLVIGGLLLAALLPVMAGIAMLLWVTAPGPVLARPVLARQLQLGLNGRPFSLLRFRTGSPVGGTVDAGVASRLRGLLRRHLLDALPQLLNVLRGDMSLVGPQPHPARLALPGQADLASRDSANPGLAAEERARLRMKPGITGWRQIFELRRRRASGAFDVANPTDADLRTRHVEQDLLYIETWSPMLDVLILLKTVSCAFSSAASR